MSVLMPSFHCRYDHYGTLCELLPAGIPSLVFCLKAVDEGKFFPVQKMVVSVILGSILMLSPWGTLKGVPRSNIDSALSLHQCMLVLVQLPRKYLA